MYYGNAQERIHSAMRLTRFVSNGSVMWQGVNTHVRSPCVWESEGRSEQSRSMDLLILRAEVQSREMAPQISGSALRLSVAMSFFLFQMGNRNEACACQGNRLGVLYTCAL